MYRASSRASESNMVKLKFTSFNNRAKILDQAQLMRIK